MYIILNIFEYVVYILKHKYCIDFFVQFKENSYCFVLFIINFHKNFSCCEKGVENWEVFKKNILYNFAILIKLIDGFIFIEGDLHGPFLLDAFLMLILVL